MAGVDGIGGTGVGIYKGGGLDGLAHGTHRREQIDQPGADHCLRAEAANPLVLGLGGGAETLDLAGPDDHGDVFLECAVGLHDSAGDQRERGRVVGG